MELKQFQNYKVIIDLSVYRVPSVNANCNDYFIKCYEQLEDRTKKKLDYFLPYINTDEIDLECVTDCTEHGGDKEFYREVLRKVG